MPRTISLTAARRLAIIKQHLAGPPLLPDDNRIMQVMRDLACIQLDPVNVVARSHLIVLWSRLGAFDPATLDRLLWKERRLFEYWAHCASIVLTEDYPIHSHRMRTYVRDDSPWSRRVREWIHTNGSLRRAILSAIRRAGPIPARALSEDGIEPEDWVSSGWTSGRNVSRMLDFLWMQGKIMVAGRSGIQKMWDLSERCLPEWTPRERLSAREVVRRAAQRSLQALGVATPRQISMHFVRGRYPNLTDVIRELQRKGTIEPVEIAGLADTFLIHADDISLLDRVEREWEPRTVLLSPFDNLICDRARTRQFFNFDYAVEIYTPESKRKYGYYVLPILHGDEFLGRLDTALDRSRSTLAVRSAYVEPHRKLYQGNARSVTRSIEELARFLGAKNIAFGRRVPRLLRG